ncbi:MFS transporter [Paenibacillus silvae]|uniref:MFS transporter n=1 Tax=Paenibacillus silvae TaxID=1325358 RepID=UPI00200311CE|nr:MFS transporter [Paenibacillus silvae]MCK6076250.1 MFS transporter [Paenibacillus silvae]MCK6150591.1 MFS transporter [Paenibacillus silvae]MCK6268851.1 MFS transporter [Paenibacillus silvae]MCK6270444.1 MFS transporter [Paenibacillus silvae]
MKSSYLTRPFYYLWTTQTAANAADVLYIMALTVMVLDRTNSLVSAALLPLMRSGAQMLSSLVAPLLIQRFQLSRLLLLSQTGQFLLFICLALYLQLNGDSSSLMLVFSLIFVMSFLDGWTTPARNALIPRLVTHEQGLLKANGLMSVSDQVVQFAGWGLSGVIVAWIGSSPTLMVTAIIYGLAAAFTIGVQEPNHADTVAKSKLQKSAGITVETGTNRWQTLTEGWKMIWQTPRLRVLTFMDMIDMLGGSIWVGAFTLAFVQVALGQGEEWWGFINAAYFAGTIGGGLLVLALAKVIGRRYFGVMMLGMAGYGVLTAIYAMNSQPLAALILVMLMGPFAELAMINRRTLIQSSVAAPMLPKVLSAQASMMHLVFCISLLGMAWLAEYIGIVNLYLFAAALTILAIVAGLLNYRAFQEKTFLRQTVK